MTLVWMFPGQSSRYPGMIDKLAALDPANQATLDQASELLGRDLGAHYQADNEAAYGRNRDVQIGVFLANHMFLTVLEQAGLVAEASLGLSLGEWNHLVHIGALDFPQALQAVEQRGEAYDAGPAGAMASVFPIALDELQEVCERVKDVGVLEVVNLNSPRQQVLSGETAALDKALSILEEDFYCEAVIIERQVPMHCSTFAPVGQGFRETLSTLTFAEPKHPYLPNRLGCFEEQPDFVELLSTHVHRPVFWQRSIDFVLDRWPDATLVEVGPKKVLTNLLDRKWHKGVDKHHTDVSDDLGPHLSALIDTLRTRT
ncbi:MAG: ACP S-malonyltransferase [Deltaproteobacteria bacterium]|nr:ACP S-malonyltransferase [Deltaproteobacteria bacterium]